MKATIYKNHRELEANSQSGALTISHIWEDGQPTDELNCILLICPGCGEETALPIRHRGDPDSHPSWELVNRDPLTLSPSILHSTLRGGCGWHGFLEDGEFETLNI